MDVTEYLSGTFLNASELANKPPEVFTIKSAGPQDLNGDKKVVIGFHETDKELTLNKTRLKILLLLD